MSTVIEVKTDPQVVFDVFVTALEGGINYWAVVEHYRWRKPGSDPGGSVEETQDVEGFTARVRDDESGYTYTINAETIREGIARVVADTIAGKATFSLYHRGAILEMAAGVPWRDLTDYDADTADIVLQYGLLGELVYG